MNIEGLVHININCSNFEKSRAFYEKLGFEVFLEVPKYNTPQVAAAVGFSEYELHGALMILRGARPPFVIDLLEWRSPRDSAPPYARLNHLGIARIAMASSDLDADLAELRARGIEIVGEPADVFFEDGPRSRFVCFKDPDGTVLELVQDLSTPSA
jgi:catechol 2,3-dioxygenase-like lactoylglutathione lyase family enzyme